MLGCRGEPSEVARSGEQVPARVDTVESVTSGSSAAPHEVGELAFDLGSGRAVVGGQVRVRGPGTLSWQKRLVTVRGDVAAAGGVGATLPQPTAVAAITEAGHARSVSSSHDRGGVASGAGDRVGVEVGLELGLGEPAAACCCRRVSTRAPMPRSSSSASCSPDP